MFLFHFAPWCGLGLGFSTLAQLLRDGLRFVKIISRSHSALAAEILFLRKQLADYREREIGPRRLTNAARWSLLLWSCLFDGKGALTVVTPATFTRWHGKVETILGGLHHEYWLEKCVA